MPPREPLTPDEEALAALLARAGLGKCASRCFACLARGGAWGTPEAVAVTGLSQPDVSTGMRALVEAGLAARERVPRTGPGRPPLRHRLAGTAGEAVAALDHRRRATLHEELAALDALRARFA